MGKYTLTFDVDVEDIDAAAKVGYDAIKNAGASNFSSLSVKLNEKPDPYRTFADEGHVTPDTIGQRLLEIGE